MNRQENNLLLLNRLYEIVLKQPDSRFSQILANYGFVREIVIDRLLWVNEYYTEPNEVVERVEENIKKFGT
jgi:hypothetical protein